MSKSSRDRQYPQAPSVFFVQLPSLRLTASEGNSSIVERHCVFWNVNTSSWSGEGVGTTRKNLTHVSCASTHATSFAIRYQQAACHFCTSRVPPGFFIYPTELDVTQPGVGLVLLTLAALYVPCLVLCKWDLEDWKEPRHHQDYYFLPSRPAKRRSFAWFWMSTGRRTERSTTARKTAAMRMKDFEELRSDDRGLRAVLEFPSPSKSKQLKVSSVMGFRLGMHVTVNPGGDSEEHHVVKGFLAGGCGVSALIIEGSLQHEHLAGEIVAALFPSESTEASDERVVEETDAAHGSERAPAAEADRKVSCWEEMDPIKPHVRCLHGLVLPVRSTCCLCVVSSAVLYCVVLCSTSKPLGANRIPPLACPPLLILLRRMDETLSSRTTARRGYRRAGSV